MSTGEQPTAARAADPLREVTRTERRNLLVTSALAIVIVKVGLIPSKIETLGIEFSSTNQSSLLYVLAGFVVYFLLAFVIYSVSDYVAWKYTIISSAFDEAHVPRRIADSAESEYLHKAVKHHNTWLIRAKYTSILRVAFDFLAPLIIGIYALLITLV